jgi:hypothetical protein
MSDEQEGVPLLVISRDNAEHYFWGTGCDGWHLVKESGLSVIEECMPACASEVAHYHRKSRQFFFILGGRLSWRLMAGGSLYSRPRLADPAWQTSPFLQ